MLEIKIHRKIALIDYLSMTKNQIKPLLKVMEFKIANLILLCHEWEKTLWQ